MEILVYCLVDEGPFFKGSFFCVYLEMCILDLYKEVLTKYTLEVHITEGIKSPLNPDLIGDEVVTFIQNLVTEPQTRNIDFYGEVNIIASFSDNLKYKHYFSMSTKEYWEFVHLDALSAFFKELLSFN